MRLVPRFIPYKVLTATTKVRALDASECPSKDERSTGTPNVTALATLMKEWYFQPARLVSL